MSLHIYRPEFCSVAQASFRVGFSDLERGLAVLADMVDVLVDECLVGFPGLLQEGEDGVAATQRGAHGIKRESDPRTEKKAGNRDEVGRGLGGEKGRAEVCIRGRLSNNHLGSISPKLVPSFYDPSALHFTVTV